MKRFLFAILASLGLLGIAYAAEVEDLDIVDAFNIGRFPEGMAPSAVNDGARALEGIVARFHEDLGCRKSTTGSANAYVFAPARAITYYDGLILCFDANFQNTGSATLNANSKGAATLQRNGAALPAGTIEIGQKVLVVYDGTNFEILSVARGITTYTDPVTTRGDIIRGDSSGDVERLAVGNVDEILGTDGTDAAWRAITSYVSTQADLEAATAITGYTSPGRQQLHPSAAKGWVKFQVDGTVDASFNVSSVTDTGTGDWTINWATDFSSANYAVIAMVQGTSSGLRNIYQHPAAVAAGTTQVLSRATSDGSANETGVVTIMATAYGDQ